MRRLKVLALTLAVALIAVSSLHAEEEQAESAQKSDQPMMQGGMMGQGGMMNMMQQMSRMMEQCNRMMSEHLRHHEGDKPAPAPDQKG